MNTTTITILVLLVFNLVLTGATYSMEVNSTKKQNTRIEVLETNQPELTDKALIVDAILEVSERLEKTIKIYDENVDIYNEKIKEHGDMIDAIVDYLK